MKPFDLEKAKEGKPVCTRDGRPVRIICYDRKDEKYPIVALIENLENNETIGIYTRYGYIMNDSDDSPSNLMMVSVKKEGWVNLYMIGEECPATGEIYLTKDEAISNKAPNYFDTVRIEWEE